jgi:hypothetical protein
MGPIWPTSLHYWLGLRQKMTHGAHATGMGQRGPGRSPLAERLRWRGWLRLADGRGVAGQPT